MSKNKRTLSLNTGKTIQTNASDVLCRCSPGGRAGAFWLCATTLLHQLDTSTTLATSFSTTSASTNHFMLILGTTTLHRRLAAGLHLTFYHYISTFYITRLPCLADSISKPIPQGPATWTELPRVGNFVCDIFQKTEGKSSTWKVLRITRRMWTMQARVPPPVSVIISACHPPPKKATLHASHP